MLGDGNTCFETEFLEIGRQTPVVPCRRRIGRQGQNIGKIIAGIERDGLNPTPKGDENDAVNRHIHGVLQVLAEAGGSCRTVTFSGQELGDGHRP